MSRAGVQPLRNCSGVFGAPRSARSHRPGLCEGGGALRGSSGVLGSAGLGAVGVRRLAGGAAAGRRGPLACGPLRAASLHCCVLLMIRSTPRFKVENLPPSTPSLERRSPLPRTAAVYTHTRMHPHTCANKHTQTHAHSHIRARIVCCLCACLPPHYRIKSAINETLTLAG